MSSLNKRVLAVCSGGLDSSVLAYRYAAQGQLSALLSVDYGQRHVTELDHAQRLSERLGVPFILIDLKSITRHLTACSLTSPVEVPDGHYAEETMKQTVVPNRNALLLATAFSIAAGRGDTHVATAVHAGDHFIYPDCRPEFLTAFQSMERQALSGLWSVELDTPYSAKTKADIVREGADLQVPFETTWSCYKGGEQHCGRCGTCVERLEAFHLAGVTDPTVYADRAYWKQVCHVSD